MRKLFVTAVMLSFLVLTGGLGAAPLSPAPGDHPLSDQELASTQGGTFWACALTFVAASVIVVGAGVLTAGTGAVFIGAVLGAGTFGVGAEKLTC